MNEKLITPQMRVGDFLSLFPEHEEILISLAPAFSKLKNPVLRRTIGRVATFQQIAVVGNIPINLILNNLRAAAGQTLINEDMNVKNDLTSKPLWFDNQLITEVLDAREMLQAGQHPLAEVLARTTAMPEGSIFELVTGFIPMPLIEKVTANGLKAYVDQKSQSEFHTYFFK